MPAPVAAGSVARYQSPGGSAGAQAEPRTSTRAGGPSRSALASASVRASSSAGASEGYQARGRPSSRRVQPRRSLRTTSSRCSMDVVPPVRQAVRRKRRQSAVAVGAGKSAHHVPCCRNSPNPAAARAEKTKGPFGPLLCMLATWWPGRESNPRHGDFQSPALPTELPGHARRLPRRGAESYRGVRDPTSGQCIGRCSGVPGRGQATGKSRREKRCGGCHAVVARGFSPRGGRSRPASARRRRTGTSPARPAGTRGASGRVARAGSR